MKVLKAIQLLFRKIRGAAVEADFGTEVHEHLRLLTERYVRQGMTYEDAAHKARRQFGSITLLQEERHQLQTIPLFDSLWRDCRHASRMMRKAPAFTAAVLLTLGLSIGATTAIFGVIDSILIRPLPIRTQTPW